MDVIACLDALLLPDLTQIICEYLSFTGTPLATLSSTTPTRSLAVLPDGRLVSGHYNGDIRVWDVDAKTSQLLKGHIGTVISLSILCNTQLASGSTDHTIRLWDLTTGHCQLLEGHDSWVRCLTVIPSSSGGCSRLASGSGDETIRIWDLQTKSSEVLMGHTGWVNALAVLPDKTHLPSRLISAANDKTIRVWDLTTSRILLTHTDPIYTLVVLPDGRLAFGTIRDVCIYDLYTGITHVLQGHNMWVSALVVLPQYNFYRLVSGTGNGVIRIWDLETKTSQVLGDNTHRICVLGVILRGASSWLITNSASTNIQMWE